MTKQEEIREGIDKLVAQKLSLMVLETVDENGEAIDNLVQLYYRYAKEIREIYHSQGVVVTVVPDHTPQIYRAVEPLAKE